MDFDSLQGAAAFLQEVNRQAATVIRAHYNGVNNVNEDTYLQATLEEIKAAGVTKLDGPLYLSTAKLNNSESGGFGKYFAYINDGKQGQAISTPVLLDLEIQGTQISLFGYSFTEGGGTQGSFNGQLHRFNSIGASFDFNEIPSEFKEEHNIATINDVSIENMWILIGAGESNVPFSNNVISQADALQQVVASGGEGWTVVS